MANNCNKRTKCSGLKRGPQYGLWIWCTLIKCFISLPCIFSTCLGVDLSVRLQPEGVAPIFYGDPLEIFCSVENNEFTNYTSDDLELTIGRKSLPTSKVNETTIKLHIDRPEKQTSTYVCLNKKTGKKCFTRVLVDSLPMNVTDFKCVSKNLESLNCSWTAPPNHASINYSLTFLFNGNIVLPACPPEKISNQFFYCIWNTSSEPRYRQQEDEYFFILKASNQFGDNTQNFTIDHFAIVKPDAPSNLKLLAKNPHSIMLKWNIPNTMANLLTCGVDHRIEYQIAKIDNKTYFHSVDATGLPPNNKTYKFLLKDLPYAFRQYEVRIYIKSKKAVKEEFWSEFTFMVFYTASEKPRRPPELIAGAFSEVAFHDQKKVWIYWKQLEEYEEAGANFTYKVLISRGTKKQILYPDKNKSLSYVELKAPWEAMDVTVWSHNVMGSSENSSYLYIPPKTDNNLQVTTFTQLAYESGTYKLSWVGKEKIDNYTLFWCQYNVTLICAGRMNFTVLDATKNSYEINLPKDHRYQFAISANNGTKTSGIVWASCAISKDSIAMYGFPVTVMNDAPGKSFVRVTWTMTCTLQERIITGYLLKYCIVVNTSSTCDPAYENEEKKEYIPDPDQMSVNITGLRPHKTYLFTLYLNTTDGLRTLNASRSITTTEDTPTKPRNIAVTDVQSNSLVISWDPPYPRNGIIGHYAIYDHEQEIHIVKVEEDSKDILRRNVTLENLKSFTNYSLTVKACNTGIRSCSKIGPNDAIFVRTKIGAPSKLRAPIVDTKIIRWKPPEIPGGTVDLYQIRKIKDDRDSEIFNTTNLSYELSLCVGVMERETYEVRAVNYDYDEYSGVIADTRYVTLPQKKQKEETDHPGEWSEPSTVTCRKDSMTMILIFLIVFALLFMGYGTLKLYKKYRKMGDIKPVLPEGLSIPEKDTKYNAYGGWNPAAKDEKPSSDEMLLLPNSKSVVTSPETKQKDTSNCGSSDHTDSTALSDTSRCAVDRQASTSDDSSNSSLNLEVETVKVDENNANTDEYSLDNSDLESLRENSPYFTENFKKDPGPVVNPATGYVDAVPAPTKNTSPKQNVQPASSSYVMASLSPPIFTTGLIPPHVSSQPPTSSGYVRHSDADIKSLINLPNLGLSPTKALGPESLPTMPSLPQPAKHGADSSYIQLQTLDAMPSFKPTVRNTVPLKPQTNRGYVTPNDPIINKHLNIMSAGQPVEESAILDPGMSPDAYCRFSWSTDPAKDNLHSLYSTKN